MRKNIVYQALKKGKDKVFYYFAVKNWGVRREYIPYKDEHPLIEKKHPLRMWWMLIRLNIHYRIFRKRDYLYYNTNSNDNRRVKLPFLEGAESEAYFRTPAISLASTLMTYDVISFDIFDTLILRPFSKPTDLFMIVGKRLNKIEFHRIRIDAEMQARTIAEERNGNREISIDDIYSIIERRTGIPKDLGIKTELEVEMQYCFANPYMKRVYQLLKEQRKHIVIVSDMYIPKERMMTFLSKSGYTDYDKLYVSCDYKVSKRTGELYQIVKKDYPGQSFVHVGDNIISDIESAKEVGWETRHYANCQDIGNQYRADGMSPLIGSAYAGIINTHLHNGIKTYSPHYEYGFIYGGLYVLGFCNWLYKKAKQEKIDKILFLARDGVIYQRIFNKYYSDVPNEYLLWSRIANTIATLKTNRDDFLRRYIFYRAIDPIPQDIENVLQSAFIDFLIDYVEEYGLERHEMLTKENYDALESLIIDHWEEILEKHKETNLPIKNYILSKVNGAKNIAIVDVGWLASGPMGLKYLLENEYNIDCTVHCWIAASRPPRPEDNISEIMDNTIETYLFNVMYNRINYDIHKNTNRGTNNLFFEMFTQAKFPSFVQISADGSYEFSIPEVENYSITQEVQKGITDFCELYHVTFANDPYMMNISGYDSYCAFRIIIRDLSFIKNYLSDASTSRLAGGSAKKQKIESLDQILNGVGL